MQFDIHSCLYVNYRLNRPPLRRPDLRQAEAQLHAADARIGVARAAYFPKISLTGYYGGESQALGDLFTGPARTWNLAGGLLQPLFAAGQIQGGVNLANARTLELERLRYDNGTVSLFEVLETERQLLLASLDAIDAERDRRNAIAELYLALGA